MSGRGVRGHGSANHQERNIAERNGNLEKQGAGAGKHLEKVLRRVRAATKPRPEPWREHGHVRSARLRAPCDPKQTVQRKNRHFRGRLGNNACRSLLKAEPEMRPLVQRFPSSPTHPSCA